MCENHIFDYIIIGAGTAGGVIAKKLTDDKSTSVLALETGTNLTKQLSSPSIEVALNLANDNKFSYNILSKTEQALGRQLRLAGGRAIGGSSSHNAMYAVRGSRELYNEWGKLVGNQWSYQNIAPLFIENETYTGTSQNPNQRGTDGPIFIRQQITPARGLINTLTQATSDVLNIPIARDYNTGIRDCTFLKSQFLQQEVGGEFVRSSTATGYLNETIVTQGDQIDSDEFGVDGRKLMILTKTTVNKILLQKKGEDYVAYGVDFVRNGNCQKAFARKGIIVAAGVFSPTILQRSGIGKLEDLAAVGVPVLIENEHVGHNLQAHHAVGMGVEVRTDRLLPILFADPNEPIALGAFKKVNGPGRNIQLIGVPAPLFVPNQDVLINNWGFNINNLSNVMSFGLVNLNPKNRGEIVIAHSDPEATPTLQFNPLDNDDDLNFIIDHYIEVYNIVQRAKQLDPAGIYRTVYPNEAIFKLTDENEKRSQLANFAKASYISFEHYGGQCKMAKSIQEGVVDGFLNVFGTKNLKVADLSVSPILPDGNTTLAAQMIGLNAVKFIQNEQQTHTIQDYEFQFFTDKDE
ncbi:GMC family oxidoreductase [Lysinibacillus xylanilyticus]|uniref:GMC family oxidoreductase n=1 Tax=Lysinibacillus xylanilyticus TaxID=582475 RepID=UPI003D063CDD